MGMTVGGTRGIVSEMNVVPLIDILLVLLVIFMMMPHRQKGLDAALPQPAETPGTINRPEPIVVAIAPDGSVRINQSARGSRKSLRGVRIGSRFSRQIALSSFRRLSRFWTSCTRQAPHLSGC